jgi:DNA repair protein RadD
MATNLTPTIPTPRWYQRKAVDDLWAWFEAGNEGNPCIEISTGGGKTHIVALICKETIQSWPDTRVLMLTHVKEILEQDIDELRNYWPNAPLGVYAAALKRRDLGEPITFGMVQSLRGKALAIGHIDIIICDECHIISHKDEGGYRQLINELRAINPSLRVIGLTATPYRMGHGMITDEPAIFSEIIRPVTIHQLLDEGHLAPLRSKHTKSRLSVEGVKVSGGDYVAKDLQLAVDTLGLNTEIADEIVARGRVEDRKHWLVFGVGIEHCEHLAEAIRAHGVTCEAVHSKLSSAKRTELIKLFKAGKVQCLTNPAMMTTGFNFPNIDLVALVRPTLSVVLYQQIVGRGMRPKTHTDYGLVLDFAGAVSRHGPITKIRPPEKKGKKAGEAPVKVCDHCHEIVPIVTRICPSCGEEFPEPETAKDKFRLHDDDIMGERGNELEVSDWKWLVHTSASSGNVMLKVRYYGASMGSAVEEYLTVLNQSRAGESARRTMARMVSASGAMIMLDGAPLESVAHAMNKAKPPDIIEYTRDGKFFRVLRRAWADGSQLKMIG